MLTKNKKGISEIVVTIIIILLAIVVFAVVSVVVRGTVSKGAENIELSANCLDVEMHAEKIAQTPARGGGFIPTSYDVTISRSGAGKSINGVKLILEDSTQENRYTMDDIIKEIKPLDKFTQAGAVFADAPFVKENAVKVTVIPFFMKKSGEVFYCDESAQTDELVVKEPELAVL